MSRITLNRLRKDAENKKLIDGGKVLLRAEDIREVFEGGIWHYGEFLGDCTYVKLEREPGVDSSVSHTVRESFNEIAALLEKADTESSPVKRARPVIIDGPKR